MYKSSAYMYMKYEIYNICFIVQLRAIAQLDTAHETSINFHKKITQSISYPFWGLDPFDVHLQINAVHWV